MLLFIKYSLTAAQFNRPLFEFLCSTVVSFCLNDQFPDILFGVQSPINTVALLSLFLRLKSLLLLVLILNFNIA